MPRLAYYRAELRYNGELVASTMSTSLKDIRRVIAEEWVHKLDRGYVIRVKGNKL